MGGKDMDAFRAFAIAQAKRRLQEGSVHNDLFYYLVSIEFLLTLESSNSQFIWIPDGE
jgi:hypothetical protein